MNLENILRNLEYGLVVRPRFADLIINGRKVWEIRKRKPKVMGKVGVIKEKLKLLIGIVEIVDVKGPFKVKELIEKYNKKHLAPEFLLKYVKNNLNQDLYAWVLKNPLKFDRPIYVEYQQVESGIVRIIGILNFNRIKNQEV